MLFTAAAVSFLAYVAHYPFWIIVCEELEYPDPPHLVGSLCTRRNRPCCRAAYQRDELSPSHVPTGPKTAHRIGSNAALIGVETSYERASMGRCPRSGQSHHFERGVT